MAAIVLSLHAAFVACVILASPVYGVIVEIFGFWCPLTALEEWLDVRGQVSPNADLSFSTTSTP